MSIEITATIPGNPSTKRATSTRLSHDKRTNRIAYTSAKTIVLRSLEDLTDNWVYTGHKYTATVAKFSPSGYYVASGDESGMVQVWDCSNETMLLKSEFQVISGRINDLSWDADSTRIIAVGDGKERGGHCFTFDSGNTVGEISGHTAQINAVDIRPVRPYRAVTVGDDSGLVFYQGPPFKFAKSIRNVHTNFIKDVKFSPNGEFIVSVGVDRTFAIYNGKEGTLITKKENIVKGGIYSVDWINDETFVIASAEGSLKSFDTNGELKSTWELEQNINNQFLAVVAAKDLIVGVTLNGNIYCFKEGETKPVKIIYGHQVSITSLNNIESKIYSGSYDGRILQWNNEIGLPVLGDEHKGLVVGIEKLSGCLISASWDDKLKKINNRSIVNLTDFDKQPIQIKANNEDAVSVIFNHELSLYNDKGEVTKSIKLDYEPSSVDISSKFVVATNSKSFEINVYDSKTLELITNKLPVMRGKPTFTSISFDEKYLAVGDANGKIMCYNLEDFTLVTSRWAFHTSRINSISWNKDNDHIASGSLDTNIIIYSVSKASKNIKSLNTHKEGVNSVKWINESEIVSGGSDSCLKFWKVTF